MRAKLIHGWPSMRLPTPLSSRMTRGLKENAEMAAATAARLPKLPVSPGALVGDPQTSSTTPSLQPSPCPPANRRRAPRPAGSSTPWSNQASWRPWSAMATGQTGSCPAMPRDSAHRLTCAERSVLAIRYQTSTDIKMSSRRVLTRDVVVWLSLLLGVEGQVDADTAGVNWRRSQTGGAHPMAQWS
jgi:hypothetical protein